MRFLEYLHCHACIVTLHLNLSVCGQAKDEIKKLQKELHEKDKAVGLSKQVFTRRATKTFF